MGNAAETKAILLKKASEIVVEKGFSTASTKEIAIAAGVSEGTLFKYFKSKDNLLNEIIFEITGKLKAETIDKSIPKLMIADYSATEKLTCLYHDRRAFFEQHAVNIRIILQELSINETVKKVFTQEILPMINQTVGNIMAEGVKKKEFIDIPVETLTVGFVNILLSPILTMVLLEDKITNPNLDHSQYLFEIYMQGIRRAQYE